LPAKSLYQMALMDKFTAVCLTKMTVGTTSGQCFG
jgi:hypothetical protein